MELETLKSVWQEQEFSKSPPTREELMTLLHKNSHGPIKRMLRNLRIELVLMGVSYGFAAFFYLTGFNGEFRRVAWLFLVIFLFFGIYFYMKNRLLRKMQCVSCE